MTDQTIDDAKNPVVVYGSNWCPFTVRVLKWLDAWKVHYHWIEVDDDSAAEEQIAAWNDGRAIRPTLDIGGAIYVNPEQSVLKTELDSRGLLGV